jgi:hypothetical protein
MSSEGCPYPVDTLIGDVYVSYLHPFADILNLGAFLEELHPDLNEALP